jgi:hypothetical protein
MPNTMMAAATGSRTINSAFEYSGTTHLRSAPSAIKSTK